MVSPAIGSAVGTVALVSVVAADVAVVAGALVPWRGGAGDQLTSFAAFGLIAVATSLGVGLVAPRAVALGAPDPVVAVVLCGAAGAGAVEALRRSLAGARA